TRAPFGREQFSETLCARRHATRESCFELSIFEREGVREFFRRFFVETCGGERVGEFVIERREAAVFAREPQGTLGLKRALLRDERARERDLRPSVTRLNRDGLT